MPPGISRQYLTVTLLLCACLTVSCAAPSPQSSQNLPSSPIPEASPKLSVYYKPPIIPIKVEYDVLNQTLNLSISGEMQTPLGTFGVSTGVATAERKFRGVRTLTIRAGERIYVYQLDTGNRYSINLPSDENGQAKVIYSSNDDNLSIVIPNPTGETVAGLREQLKAEQEARNQERSEVEAREAERRIAEQADAEAQRRGVEEEEARRQREWQSREAEHRREVEEERRRNAEIERRQREAESRSQEVQRQGDVPTNRRGEIGRPSKGDVIREVLKTTNEILKDVQSRRGTSRQRP